MDSDNIIIKAEEQQIVQINAFPTNEHQQKLKNEQQAETSSTIREDQHRINGIKEHENGNNVEDEANNIVVDILNNDIGTSNGLQQQFPLISHEFLMGTTNGNDCGGINGSGGNRENHHGDPTMATEEDDDETPPPQNYHHQQQHYNRRSSSSQQQNLLLKEELLGMDSGDELPPAEEVCGENAPPIHEIRCGLLTARLHMSRFTCPGIHRKCVEFEGKLISPRQFTIKAEKDKQKDWKGSIRLGKHNLRTLMEMKTLDFFEHATNCSLKCQSRNYIKNRKGSENGGGETQTQQISTFGTENGSSSGTGSLDLIHGEQIDIKSVASSSSAASTRKSSAAVLEDFVSQTIPSMAFGGYGGDQFQVNGGEDEMNGNGQQNGHKTPIPITNSHLRAPPPSTTPHGQQNGHTIHNNLATVSIAGPTIHSQSASSPFHVTANSLNFLQQSPLKQLFGGGGRNQQQQITVSNSHLPSSILPTIPPQAMTGNNRRPSAPSIDSINSNIVQQQDAAALALLLQSVQASILLEQQQQQQKVQQHHQNQQNGTTTATNNANGGILAQLLTINNALHPPTTPMNNSPTLMGTVAPGGGNHHSSTSSSLLAAALNTTTNGNNNNGGIPLNGIERLLAAAALFPPHPHQLQPTNLLHSQQKTTLMTPLKEQQSTLPLAPMNAQNIRKSMEENPSLFWSHMRNMGLLEDMLKILSETLEKLKQIYLHGGNAVSEEFAAQRLSGVALALDLSTLFGEKVHSRYIQATLESTLINKEILELQRKQEEQKRKLENAKRKSQCFDQLLKNGTAIGRTNGHGPQPAGGHRNGGPTTNGGNSVLENGGPEMKKIHLNI